METFSKRFLNILLTLGVFLLYIVVACDAAPGNSQAIVKDYSFRFDNKHTFITLDISKSVKHNIQTVERNVIAIILKNSKLGEIDPMIYVDSDTLKNISFAETGTKVTAYGDVKITLSLKNHSGVNVRKDTKRIFIDIYPEILPPVLKSKGGRGKGEGEKVKVPSPLVEEQKDLPEAEVKKNQAKARSSRRGFTRDLVPAVSSDKIIPAPERNEPSLPHSETDKKTQTPKLKFAALHESIDKLKEQEGEKSLPESPSSPLSQSGELTPPWRLSKGDFQNLEIIGSINPLWYLQFFIDIILVLCVIILWRRYTLLKRNRKDFKTVLAEPQQSHLSSAEQPVNEIPRFPPGVHRTENKIPSFNQEIQAAHYLENEEGSLENEEGRRKKEEGSILEENAPGRIPQATGRPKRTEQNLTKEENHSDSRPRPPIAGKKASRRISNSGQSDNAKEKMYPQGGQPTKGEETQTASELSKDELQSALAKINSQIEGLMGNKKDEQKQPSSKKEAKEARETLGLRAKRIETIKKLAKGGMNVNSIAKKLGIPSGEVELILNLSDDE